MFMNLLKFNEVIIIYFEIFVNVNSSIQSFKKNYTKKEICFSGSRLQISFNM